MWIYVLEGWEGREEFCKRGEGIFRCCLVFRVLEYIFLRSISVVFWKILGEDVF